MWGDNIHAVAQATNSSNDSNGNKVRYNKIVGKTKRQKIKENYEACFKDVENCKKNAQEVIVIMLRLKEAFRQMRIKQQKARVLICLKPNNPRSMNIGLMF